MINEQPRVSPTVEGYSAENARITESEHQKQLTELEKINRERAINEREIIAKGSFRIGMKGKPLFFCEILAAAATFFAISFILSTLASGMFPALFSIQIAADIVIVIAPVVIGYILIMTVLVDLIRGGNEYKYQANLREFSFSRNNGKGGVAHFFYKDILSVDYSPHKFLWFDNGYYVSIETKSGFFTYKYVFPRFRHRIPVERLPFEVIREQIAENQSLPEQQSVRLGLSKKKTAVMLGLTLLCILLGALPIIMQMQLYYIVVFAEFAILGIIPCILTLIKGEVYRYRSDSQELLLRQADGDGKPTRIKFIEVQDIVYKRRLLSARVVIKTKDKTLKFRYIYPKPFQMKLLCETPFAVFAK